MRVDGGDGGYGKTKKTFSRVTSTPNLNEDWIIDLEDRIIAMEDGQWRRFKVTWNLPYAREPSILKHSRPSHKTDLLKDMELKMLTNIVDN